MPDSQPLPPPAGTRRFLPPESLTLAALLTLAVGLGPLATDLYLPSLPSIGIAFGRSVADIQLTLSVYIAGFAVSQLFSGPLSDRFGRRPVMLAGFAVFLAASVLAAFAPSLEVLLAARFLQALGACAGPVIGRAVVRDIYGPARAAKVFSYMATAWALAPAIGPIIGGLLETLFGWRANFWALAAVSLFLLVVMGLRQPETNHHPDPTATRPRRILGNFATLVGHRSYIGHALMASFAYAGIFAFISGSSFLLIDVVGLSPAAYGFAFAAVVLGYMVGTFTSGRIGHRLGSERLLALGVLAACVAGALGIGLALGVTPSVASILIPMTLYLVGCGLLLPNAMAGALRYYPRMAGAASSLLGCLQMAIAALVGIAVGHLHDGTAVPMTGAIAAAALAMLLSWLLLARPGAAHDKLHRALPEH
ncbi:MAG TPA: multidrug effflux MFS transporter [Kiloniellales bacterium]|nr:multidrug effflux MFS transporter [Kiloniellales bacterium]